MKKPFILSFLILIACGNPDRAKEKTQAPADINPAAEGFNAKASDSKAINIADSVMAAMGGRQAWDSLKILQWNFFGRRDLLWNKTTGDVRIEIPSDSMIFLVNLKENKGEVFKNGRQVIEKDTLGKLIEKAESIWINDSYWLIMPFKLKDSGVTLKYMREDTLAKGNRTHVLQLTFEGVGDTPQNKYEVYVDKADYLIKQWAYFADSNQEQPSAVWPWDNYQEINGLKLSFNRSDGKGPRDVKTFTAIDSAAFSSPDWSFHHNSPHK